MAWLKSCVPQITLVGLLSLGLTIPFVTQLQAQLPPKSLSLSLPNQWEFKPPSGIKKPGNRQQGATRSPNSQCLLSNQSITLLVPSSGKAFTAQAYPRFFWYLPQTSAEGIEFILRDENNVEVYSTQYRLTPFVNTLDSNQRFMSLQLPAFSTLKPLEIGKEYYWELSLVCNIFDRSADIVVEATVERVSLKPELRSQIQQATPTEKIALYANQRLWHETLMTLLELRLWNPDDSNLADAWNKLLRSVDLNNLSEQSLTDISSSKEKTTI